MAYPYTRTTGTVTYTGGGGTPCGQEWFSVHNCEGRRFVRAVCEMDEDALLRDTSWSLDENWRPIDGHVRIALNGKVSGSTWYAFDGNSVTCHARTNSHGDITQVRQSDRAYEFLGLHPLVCDGMLTAVRGCNAPNEERIVNAITCSYSQNGETELIALPIEIGVTYLTQERISVPAGDFDAHKFDVRWRREWPPAAYWVWGDDFVFVKSTWEISELTCELASLDVTGASA